VKELKAKSKAITGRNNAMRMDERIAKLKQIITGWMNYFGIADMRKLSNEMDEWPRRRIRMCYRKRWKRFKTRHDNLVRLGIDEYKAWEYANTRKGY